MTYTDLAWVLVGWAACFAVGHVLGWKRGFDAAERIWRKCAEDINADWKRKFEDVIHQIQVVAYRKKSAAVIDEAP